MSATQASAVAVPGGLVRGATTWYAYLALGGFTYLVSSQGNIFPPLREELGLTYGEVSLHASAIALGMLILGAIAERIIHRFGRAAMLRFGLVGSAVSFLLLTVAPAAWASIGCCLLFGITAAFIPAIVPALLADLHGERKELAFTESNAACYALATCAPLVAGFAYATGWSWRLVPIAGAISCIAVLIAYLRTRVPDAEPANSENHAPLPPAYWGYWVTIGLAVALEFSVLLWAPAYLEHVVGLSPSNAAIAGASFFLAMLVGRTAGIALVRRFTTRRLYLATMATTLIGFVFYWGGASVAPVAIAGFFIVGLGIALLFPLTLGFAIGAAGPASDRASARVMIAPGLAVLLNPPLLGSLADSVGLWMAQVTVPAFVVLSLVAFGVGNALQRRALA